MHCIFIMGEWKYYGWKSAQKLMNSVERSTINHTFERKFSSRIAVRTFGDSFDYLENETANSAAVKTYNLPPKQLLGGDRCFFNAD